MLEFFEYFSLVIFGLYLILSSSLLSMELVPKDIHKDIAAYVMKTNNEKTLSTFIASGYSNLDSDDQVWSCNKAWSKLAFMQTKPIATNTVTLSFDQMMALSSDCYVVLKKLYYARDFEIDALSGTIVDKGKERFHHDRSIYVAISATAKEQNVLRTMPDYAFQCLKMGRNEQEDILVHYKYSLPTLYECAVAIEQLIYCNPVPALMLVASSLADVCNAKTYVIRDGVLERCTLEKECNGWCARRVICFFDKANQPEWTCRCSGNQCFWK